jgi:hypothetical protein
MSPLEKIGRMVKPRYSYSRRSKEKVIDNTVRNLRKVQWRYRNVILLILSIGFASFILSNKAFDPFIEGISGLGYLGALIPGFMHSFSLTIIPATAIFFRMGRFISPVIIAAIGAFGCTVGDYLIFRFVKNQMMEELVMLGENVHGRISYHGAAIFSNSIFYRIFPFSNLLLSENFRRNLVKISYSKAWKRAMLCVAAIAIAMPFPNEIGVAIVGMADLSKKQSLVFFYVVSFIGILAVSYLGMG